MKLTERITKEIATGTGTIIINCTIATPGIKEAKQALQDNGYNLNFVSFPDDVSASMEFIKV
jgi:hypothetical protein